MDPDCIQRLYKEVGATYTPPDKHGDDEYDALDDIPGD
jgi:hypothetical protein